MKPINLLFNTPGSNHMQRVEAYQARCSQETEDYDATPDSIARRAAAGIQLMMRLRQHWMKKERQRQRALHPEKNIFQLRQVKTQ